MIAKSKSIDSHNTAISVDLKEIGLTKVSAIQKEFNVNGVKRKIALLGSTTQNYKEIIEVLDLMEEEAKKR